MAAPESLVFPVRVPAEVKSLVKATHTMDKPIFRRLIKLALGYLQGGGGQEEQEAAISHLCDTSQANTEEQVLALSVQYAGAVSLLRTLLRLNTTITRQDALVADLTTVGLPGDYAVDIGRVVYGMARPDIDRQLVANSPALPTLTHMSWRVDVTISTSWLSRVLEPVVVVRLETSSGSSHTFQLTLHKFHQLRFTVASLLHQMETLQTAPICKK